MKSAFPAYYQPTAGEFRKLWETCFLALGANALLKVYRYTPKTRKELLSVLNHMYPGQ